MLLVEYSQLWRCKQKSNVKKELKFLNKRVINICLVKFTLELLL